MSRSQGLLTSGVTSIYRRLVPIALSVIYSINIMLPASTRETSLAQPKQSRPALISSASSTASGGTGTTSSSASGSPSGSYSSSSSSSSSSSPLGSSSGSGFSGGAIGGIVGGVVGGVVLIILGALWWYYVKRQRKTRQNSEIKDTTQGAELPLGGHHEKPELLGSVQYTAQLPGDDTSTCYHQSPRKIPGREQYPRHARRRCVRETYGSRSAVDE